MKGWRFWVPLVGGTVVLLGVYFVGVAYPSMAAAFGGLPNLVPFLAALLTFYYVVLTASMVQTMSRAQEEETRARVLVTLEFERGEIFVVIRNIGRTPAHAVRLDFEPNVVLGFDDHPEQKFMENPIAFLPPGYVIRSSIGFWIEVIQKQLPMQYHVRLTYSLSWRSKPITEQYDLNIPETKPGAEYLALADVSELARNLHEVAHAIHQMDSNRGRIAMVHNMFGGVPIIRIENLDELAKLVSQNSTATPPPTPIARSGKLKRALKVFLDL